METSDVLLVALIVLVPAALMWAVFIARTGSPTRGPRPKIGIPRALRPAPADDVLEGRRLERAQTWGLVSTIAIAIFIPAYWLPESQRQEHFEERFSEEALHRGELRYNPAPELPEDIGGVEFKEIEEAIQLGLNCAFCHAGDLGGGPVPGGYIPIDSEESVQYQAPPLNNIFQRWDEEVIRFTIERGRPGTPMPAWGIEYGGPLNEQGVSDLIAYIKSQPENQEAPELPENATGQEIFEARCAVCHGPEGQGKEDDALWFSGMALWQGDVTHLTEQQHYQTILNGRRFAYMPQFGEAPSQGIPVPNYPLTEEQIRAVMEYERSL